MIITYDQNPLRSVIVLDEGEKKLLWHKLKIEYLQQRLAGTCIEAAKYDWTPRWHLFSRKSIVDRINSRLAFDHHWLFTNGESGKAMLDEYVDVTLESYLEELKGPHLGDCICEPMPCGKCHAEELLGIDTIEGLDKRAAYKLGMAFQDGRNLGEAIEWLRNYDPHADWEGSPAYPDRWKEEAQKALGWLQGYRNCHFAAIGVREDA